MLALLPILPTGAADSAEPITPDEPIVIVEDDGVEPISEEQLASTGSTTRCSTLKTCATAIAESSAPCQRPFWGAVSCVGGSALGGHGVSGLGLPGKLAWTGWSSCYECGDTKYASGTHTWPGGGFDGKGGGKTVDHPILTKVSYIGRVCVSYTVASSTTATASVVVGGVTADGISASDTGRANGHLCNW
ncbi:MAG: hypothetical protein ACLGIK_08490 [Gemmatimonadota bacterium]